MKIPAILQRVALTCMVILLILIFRSALANPLPPDSDNDGMLDAWEMQYFGNLSQGPNTDFDGDTWGDGFQLDGRGIFFVQLDQYWTLGLGAMF